MDNYVPDIPYCEGSHRRNTTGRYNRNGRGIPDLAAVGRHIVVNLFNKFDVAGGTSASTPIVAALFNRIVEERMRAGKGSLGFVNPTLYKNPGVLKDILEGRNNVNCRHAFMCAPGWDPVAGLGTPHNAKLLDLFMSLP